MQNINEAQRLHELEEPYTRKKKIKISGRSRKDGNGISIKPVSRSVPIKDASSPSRKVIKGSARTDVSDFLLMLMSQQGPLVL
jgi:hypothetical protein